MSAVIDEPLPSVLLAETTPRWYDFACERWQELLVDHSNCEKKAASTALSLIFTYAPDTQLTDRLSRLAREELRHFEQVQKVMRELGVPFMRLSPSRYADALRRCVRTREPDRLVDLLLLNALIEARSCERFLGLAPRLQSPIGAFYRGLAQSEARHHALYIRLVDQRVPAANWAPRLQELAQVEADLIISPDPMFRFHSGDPA